MKNTFRNERTMLDISFLYYLASYHHIIFFSEGTIHLLDAQASLQLITSLISHVCPGHFALNYAKQY